MYLQLIQQGMNVNLISLDYRKFIAYLIFSTKFDIHADPCKWWHTNHIIESVLYHIKLLLLSHSSTKESTKIFSENGDDKQDTSTHDCVEVTTLFFFLFINWNIITVSYLFHFHISESIYIYIYNFLKVTILSTNTAP